MKKKTIAITSFPALYALILTGLALLSSTGLNATGALDFVKGLAAISLVVLFPFMILAQGILSGFYRMNGWLTLGLSVLATLLFLGVLQAHDTRNLAFTMLHYGRLYSISGLVGYLVGHFVINRKNRPPVINQT